MTKYFCILISLFISSNCFADACEQSAYNFAKEIIQFSNIATNGLSLGDLVKRENDSYTFHVWEDYNSNSFKLEVEIQAILEETDVLRGCVPVSFKWKSKPF